MSDPAFILAQLSADAAPVARRRAVEVLRSFVARGGDGAELEGRVTAEDTEAIEWQGSDLSVDALLSFACEVHGLLDEDVEGLPRA